MLEGLYKSSGNFCTQCEAEGFRGITYFYDRPDVMSKYIVRIEADSEAYPQLLSNGNLLESGKVGESRCVGLVYAWIPNLASYAVLIKITIFTCCILEALLQTSVHCKESFCSQVFTSVEMNLDQEVAHPKTAYDLR